MDKNNAFVRQAPQVPQPYLAAALHKVLSEKDIKDVAKTMTRALAARTMISRRWPSSFWPPYGTILTNKAGEHAMYLGRAASDHKITVPGNMMVILDDEPYVYQCTDMQLMKQWQIVSEAQK